jgi:starch synthase (maltosyl-transferring)
VGEAVVVRAIVLKEGHDVLAGRALLYPGNRKIPTSVALLTPLGDDDWAAVVVPSQMGPHRIVVEAWTDRYSTWAHKVRTKLDAGVPVEVEIAEGIELLARAGAPAGPDQDATAALGAAVEALRDDSLTPPERLTPALRPAVAAALAGPQGATDLTASMPQALWVDRDRALVGAWYELFPRSFGGFKGVANRVPELAAMGFDVLYLPPIHPIGHTARKGPNNTLGGGIDDPGSPWAIGSHEGGHTAIHPDLGTVEDFSQLLAELRAHGMEMALDYALQCSPDHPWVREHPEWFHHRPDGTIACAENPPKVYQDIYPINFWPARDADRAALWQACKDILDHWISLGVAIFRVDNPHTKPFAFWEWVIQAVQADHPEVLFLSEAFTRPRVMARLAEAGFSQSYTYFTWRTEQHGPEGLWAYLDELAHGPVADYMRPNFWPNTPDILSGPLRYGPPSAFAVRLVLAATMSPSYGIYSGYELYENLPASDLNEEYLNSEKYEIKDRDFHQHGTLAPLMTALNDIRRRHPALQRLRSIQFHPTSNSQIIAYSKLSDDGRDAVLIVANLDPHHTQEATLYLDLAGLGLPTDSPYQVIDELSGERYEWLGAAPYVRLDPYLKVAHILDLRGGHPGGTGKPGGTGSVDVVDQGGYLGRLRGRGGAPW